MSDTIVAAYHAIDNLVAENLELHRKVNQLTAERDKAQVAALVASQAQI